MIPFKTYANYGQEAAVTARASFGKTETGAWFSCYTDRRCFFLQWIWLQGGWKGGITNTRKIWILKILNSIFFLTLNSSNCFPLFPITSHSASKWLKYWVDLPSCTGVNQILIFSLISINFPFNFPLACVTWCAFPLHRLSCVTSLKADTVYQCVEHGK